MRAPRRTRRHASLRRAAALLAAALCAAPAAAQTQWGLRAGGTSTLDGVKKQLGASATALELYAHYQKPDSKLGFEGAVGGWGLSAAETGNATDGVTTSAFRYEQQMIVVPVVFSLLYGPRTAKGSLQGGGGFGVYLHSIQRTLTFADPAFQSSFGFRENPTTATAGPHLQVSGDYYFNKYFGAAFFGRFGWARSDLGLFRGYQGSSGNSAFFRERDDAGNIAGFSYGMGLAVRF